MRTGTIYIIKNNINDKVYIGQTLNSLEERWRQHTRWSKDLTKNYKIYNAIRKHGIENFYIEILEDNIQIDVLDKKEIKWISEFDSYNNGYNSTNGGDGKHFNGIEEQEIISLYLSGISTIKLGEEYEVSWTTINRILDKNSIEKHQRKAIDNEELFIKDYLDGTPLSEMAKKYDVDLKTITRYRDRLSLPKRLKRKRESIQKEYDKDNFIKDYNSNMRMQELANKYEVDVKTIRKRRDELDLDKNRRNIPKKSVNEILFVEDYNMGLSWKELCVKYGISETTGAKIRDRLGLDRRKLK